MVVMETVRAATMASARRMERMKAEAEKQAAQASRIQSGTVGAHGSRGALNQKTARAKAPMSAFSPIASSSPRATGGSVLPAPSRARSALRNTSTTTMSFGADAPLSSSASHRPPSPILSDEGSTVSLPDELVRYRQHPYMAPEKLQIVKPLEGSMTLLKWKLLATPQLGGATTFFSDASLPGVHKKAGQTLDESSLDLKQKSASTFDLSSTSPTHHSTGSLKRRHSKRGREREGGIRTKAGADLDVGVGMESGMNVMTELHPPQGHDVESSSATGNPDRSPSRRERGREEAREGAPSQLTGAERGGDSPSLLRQVGNFLGLSRFSRQVEPQPVVGSHGNHTSEREGKRDSSGAGLAGLL